MDTLWIKTNELIKKAFELWDIKDWSIEEIDPVVKLLFAACANESLHLDKHINDSAFLTKESLLNTFLPFSHSGPKPACAMIQAMPVESQVKLNDKIIFEHEKFVNRNNKREAIVIPFRPAFDTMLLKASIRYSFSFDRLITFPGQEELDVERHPESQNSIWIGLKMDDSIRSLDGLSVFFNVIHPDHKDSDLSDYDFFDNIKLIYESRELLLNKPLDSKIFYQLPAFDIYQYSYNLVSYSDLLYDALSYYAGFYYQISGQDVSKLHLHKKKFPEFFNEIFQPEMLKRFKEDLIWLEFRFDSVQPNLLKKLEVQINAFPVINHKIIPINLDKEESVQRIPVGDDEDMIGVISYKTFDIYHNPVNTSQAVQIPFIIRDMEMEKYSKRDLFDLIEELTDRFVSDNQAFQEEFNIETDVMNRLRDSMRPVIAAKLKMKKCDSKRNIYALYSIDNKKEISGVELACSITNGSQANAIPAGERLKTSNALINQNEIYFLTKTVNGRDRMSADDKASTVRRLMLSGDKIVTSNDISEFCYSVLGNSIKILTIQNGAYRHESGLRRCLDANIKLNKGNIGEEDILVLKKSLENKIKNRSSLLIPVVVNLSFDS